MLFILFEEFFFYKIFIEKRKNKNSHRCQKIMCRAELLKIRYSCERVELVFVKIK